MPTCGGCSQICNCYVNEDGFFAERSEDGRRNTVVSGGGFDANNPFILEFQLSELYLPPSTEVRVPLMSATNAPLFSEVYNSVTFDEEHFFQYESPEPGVITPPPALLGPGSARPTLGVHIGEFNLIGASAKFPPAASGNFALTVAALSPSDFALTGVDLNSIAGSKMSANPATSTYCSCYGFAPSRFEFGNISTVLVGPPKLQLIYVELFQSTGSTINVTDIKVWLTTI